MAEKSRSRIELPESYLGKQPSASGSKSPPRGRHKSLTPSSSSATSPAPSTPSLSQAGPSVGATASTKDSSPWFAIAQKKLLEHGLQPPSNTSGHLAGEIIAAAIQDCQTAIKNADGNKFVAMKRLEEILKTFDRYAKVVDSAVQHSPEITAWVWAGVRAILQIALNHMEVIEGLEAVTAIIAEKMAIYDFFGNVYEETRISEITLSSATTMSNLQQALNLALPEFYATILVFTIKARQYFDPSTSQATNLKHALKPFTIKFQPFIDEISEKEKWVRNCIDVATMETIKTNSRRLLQVHSALTDLQKELMLLTKLHDIMNTITENVKMTSEIPDRQKGVPSARSAASPSPPHIEITPPNIDARVNFCSNNTTYQDNSINNSVDNSFHSTIINNYHEGVHKLLKMLSPLESPKRHQDIRSSRLDGTGTWLLNDQRFLLWRDSPTQNRILCCYGHPGAGKTVISSIVVDSLASHFHGQAVGIAVIYCDYRDQASQTVVNILGSILHQLLLAASRIPDEVEKRLESIQKQCKRVEIGDISQMLKVALAQFHHTGIFVCIDALDELEPRTLHSLMASLRDEFRTVRVFLTGRPWVQQNVNRYLKTQQQDAINIIPDLADIRAYLEHEIMMDSEINPDAMNSKLKDEILNAITTSSKGMFLLPTLHISMVLQYQTIAKRRKALGILPQSLGDAFSGMVDRILKSPEDLGKRTLLLLHLAYRPLKLEELRHALAVKLGNTESDNIELDEDNIPSRKTILDCCLGLVIVDEETMTVRFVHYTLEEHFKKCGNTYFPDRYSTVAEICLTYLNYGKLRYHCPTYGELERQFTQFAFLRYAACYWGHYARQQSKDSVTELSLILLHQEGKPPCAFQTLYSTILGRTSWNLHTVLLTGLHVAAYFGLEEYMASLMGDTVYLNATGEEQRTPLSYAAENGHEGVVRLLLERGVDAESKDKYGISPLSYAAKNGREAVVRLLLERGVDADSKDNIDWSPLLHAAWNGHEAIVRLLLEQGVDAESKDKQYGMSPLSYAAWNGREAVVRLLLEQGVDADSKNNDDRSPLSYAAENGHEAVVRLLLEQGVDADSKNNDDRSPLSYAAENGHEAVVRLLLERGVDADSMNNDNRSPLSYAARNGNEAVVRLLLERGVDADSNDNDNRSPLSYAARNGNEAVVRLLLERGVDAESKGMFGQSPLSDAALFKHKAIVTLLQQHLDSLPAGSRR